MIRRTISYLFISLLLVCSAFGQREEKTSYVKSALMPSDPISVPTGKSREEVLFREALERTREYRSYFALINETGKMVKKEDLIDICNAHNYLYLDKYETKEIDRFGDKASSVLKFWFMPKESYWRYVFEWTDRTSTKCESLKKRGSLWFFDVNQYNASNKLRLIGHSLWTGNVVDGYVDGTGVGFRQLAEHEYCYFSGEFRKGFPVGKVTFRLFKTDGTSWGYSPREKKGSNGAAFHTIEVGEMHDGMALFRYLDNGGDNSGKASELYGYVSEEGKVTVKPIYKTAHAFNGGKAVVKNDKGQEIYIDKFGADLGYTEAQQKIYDDAKAEEERIKAEAEKQRLLAEQKEAEEKRLAQERRVAYLQKIRPLMDKSKWQRGDRVCLEFGRQGQYITGTVEEWNGDKSKCRIKIVTSPNGNMSYNGDMVSKNNLIWIPTSGEGWHKALPEEIEAANAQDNSIPTQDIQQMAICPDCNGKKYIEESYRAGLIFHYTDTRVVDCPRCGGTGFIMKSQTIKKF